MVVGLDNPIIQGGFIAVPETPGLGITLKEEVLREHIEGDLFPGSEAWNEVDSHDRLWS